MAKPAALQDDTVSDIKAWVNQPKNAALLAGALVGFLVLSAIYSSMKTSSAEAAAVAKGKELAAGELGSKALAFAAAQGRFPASNEEMGLPPRRHKSWLPLQIAEVRADGTAYFEYANLRERFGSNPQFQIRLQDIDGKKAGSCIASRSVSVSALQKNGLSCETAEIDWAPPVAEIPEGAVAAAPAPVDPALAPEAAGAVEGESAQPTDHLAVSRDVVQADHVISAIDRDDAATLTRLKAEGVPVCEPNPEGRLPIVEAARSGQMKSLMFLIAVPCPLQQLEPFSQSTALISAISLRNARAANALLAAGADPNFAPAGKPTPWLLLGDGEETEIMQLRDALTARGANINLPGPDGSTLLIRAATRGSLEMVRWLISRNADLNLQDKRGRSAVMMATITPSPNSVKILHALIGAKADLNLRDNENFTALGRIMTMTEDPTRQKEVQVMLMRAGGKG